jgi:hypothetical protein
MTGVVMRSPGPGVINGALHVQRYAVRPQKDGGIWRGPTDADWMKRILRGASPPHDSSKPGHEPVVAHG